MKKKAGMEREKKESETNGDDVRGGRDGKEGEEERRGRAKGKGNECLKSIEAGDGRENERS